ncbi:MAG: dihydroorotate dehydrogenase electron transfer subunit [Sporolactobacillus sp.]
MNNLRLEILSNEAVHPRYFRLVLNASELAEPVMPGQFFHIRCEESWQHPLRRPLSVYSYNSEVRRLEFVYLVKGAGTRALATRRCGERLDVLGPLGRPFSMPPSGAAVLLVARGIGVAALHAMAERLRPLGYDVAALISARRREDLLAIADLQQLGVELYTVTDEDGSSAPAAVAPLLQHIVHTHAISRAFTCGSRRLARLMQSLAAQHPSLTVEVSLEAHMACGLGDCYGCTCQLRRNERVLPARVCVDGPVFPIEQVVL